MNAKKGLIILCCVLLGTLVGLGFATAYAGHLLSLIQSPSESTLTPEQAATMTVEPDSPDSGGISLHPTDITFPAAMETLPKGEDTVNILLIGQDRRSGQGRQRADAIILCSFQPQANTLCLISFLRDTYLPIPGYHPHRVNSAYHWGGSELLKNTLRENFGVVIDACIAVDFSGFQACIDTLGGVPISLTAQEAKHLNSQNSWNLTSGLQTLNGKQALAYARIRAIGNDFGRTQRQRNVLTSLLEKAKTMGLSTALSLCHQLLPLLSTDMSNQQILSYLAQLFPLVSSCQVKTAQIPAPQTFQNATVNSMAVLIPDLQKNRVILGELFPSG